MDGTITFPQLRRLLAARRPELAAELARVTDPEAQAEAVAAFEEFFELKSGETLSAFLNLIDRPAEAVVSSFEARTQAVRAAATRAERERIQGIIEIMGDPKVGDPRRADLKAAIDDPDMTAERVAVAIVKREQGRGVGVRLGLIE